MPQEGRRRQLNWLWGAAALPLALLLTGCVVGTTGPSPDTGATPEAMLPAPTLLIPVVQQAGIAARAADPLTLADLPGVAPIDLGHHCARAVSPDGSRLAVIAWPGNVPQQGQLTVVEMDASRQTTYDQLAINDAELLQFDARGEILFWFAPSWRDPDHGMPRAYQLYRLPLGQAGPARTLLELGEDLIPWDMRALDTPGRLAVLAVPTGADGLTTGWAEVEILDPDSGGLIRTIPLEGISIGQYSIQAIQGYEAFNPGIAWDPRRGLLYLVHTELGDEWITLVDLRRGRVLEQRPVAVQGNPWQRALRLFVDVAEAKAVPGTDHRALLSPDGSRLYMMGTRRVMEQDAEGAWSYEQVPLGLRVIDANRLLELGNIDLPVDDAVLSPDGSALMLLTMGPSGPGGGTASREVVQHAILLDALTLKQAYRFTADGVLRLHGFGPDSRHAYMSRSWEVSQYVWRTSLYVLDARTGEELASREFEGGGVELIWTTD